MVPPVVRRAWTHSALILSVVLTAVTAAALFATLATVGGTVLSRSVMQRIEATKATDTVIAMTGPVSRPNYARTDTALRDLMRATLGRSPFAVDRSEIAQALDLPAAYGKSSASLITPIAATGIRAHTTLVSGAWPAAPRPGAPLDAALPVDVARTLALRVGTVLTVTESFTAAPVAVRVSGLFRADDPASAYWQLSPIRPGSTETTGDVTGYGPVVVDPAALSGGPLVLDSAAWIVQPDLSGVAAGDLRPLAGAVAQLENAVSQSTALFSIRVTSTLPNVLTAASDDAWAALSALAVATALSALLALAALLLAVQLLRMRREVEASTLRARGGAGWQLAALNTGEALACGLIAAVGGAYAGVSLGGALTPTATPLGAPTLGMWLAAGAAALSSTLIVVGAAAGASSPVEAWVRRSRQSNTLLVARRWRRAWASGGRGAGAACSHRWSPGTSGGARPGRPRPCCCRCSRWRPAPSP